MMNQRTRRGYVISVTAGTVLDSRCPLRGTVRAGEFVRSDDPVRRHHAHYIQVNRHQRGCFVI